MGALVLGLVFFLPRILSLITGIASNHGITLPVGTTDAASTMDSFCDYLNSGAIQRAYNLTSQNYQSQHSIGEFSNRFGDSDLNHGGCLHNSPTTSNGGSVMVPFSFAKLNLSDGSSSTSNYTATLIQANNAWVIESIV